MKELVIAQNTTMLSPEELVNKLKKINWKEIYDEHYGKQEVEKELPKGKDLQKHFYNNEKWFKHINKNHVEI